MKTNMPQVPTFKYSLALALISTRFFISFSAPVIENTTTPGGTTSVNTSFYSELYSLNETCPYLPKVKNDSFMSLKLNSMCNQNQTETEQASKANICLALRDLFPKLCILSAKKVNVSSSSTNLTAVPIDLSNSTYPRDLVNICQEFSQVLRDIRQRNDTDLLRFPWNITVSKSKLCAESCRNIPETNTTEDKDSGVNPACVLLLEGFKMYQQLLPPVNTNTTNNISQSTLPNTNVPSFNANTSSSESSVVQRKNQSDDIDTHMTTFKRTKKKGNLSSAALPVVNEIQSESANTLSPPLNQSAPASMKNQSTNSLEMGSVSVKNREGITQALEYSLAGSGTVQAQKQSSVESPIKEPKLSNDVSANASSSARVSNDTTLRTVDVSKVVEQNPATNDLTKSENTVVSSSSTTSTTSASVELANRPNDLPAPPSVGSSNNLKTSPASPGKFSEVDNDALLQKGSTTTIAVVDKDKDAKVDSVFDSMNDKENDMNKQKTLTSSSKKKEENVADEEDTYDGLEIPSSEVGKVGKKESDDDFQPDIQGFPSYNTAEKDSPRGRLKQPVTYIENPGTTINVSVNNGDPEESGFFNYFMFVAILVGILYLVVHNKKRLIAYVVEGRRPRSRSRRSSTSSNQYRRLENNFD